MKLYSFKTLIEIAGVTPGFIKRLEEAELIFPRREGNEIWYTENEIRKLLLAKDLREMGVNFAGIEVILDVSDRLLTMRIQTKMILHEMLPYIDEKHLHELFHIIEK
ncbi:MAG TPA: MerR family transcriptional regulator [Thermodesulfobacteriota bacterium]|nr:MerR family transcriptional regulator [Thermodesulfobacteriota bacterium]